MNVQTMPSSFTLWMERGFSRGPIAERMLRAASLAGIDLRVISTPKQKMQNTETLALPWLKEGTSAIEQANRLIAEYGIDALWVQRSASYDLSGIKCTVHAAATPEVIELVDNKARFTEWLGDDSVRAPSVEVVGVQAVINEYWRRRQEGQEVCVKPVKGVNGFGYWHLTDGGDSLIFSDPDRRRMPPAAYFTGLSIEDDPKNPTPILMMEWLPGPEVSIDILCWEGEPLIHAARTKVNDDCQRVQSEHPMLAHARSLAKRLKLHGIISVQYRLDAAGNWKILEINPRPAGGSIHSEDAGFGLIAGWTQLLTGAITPGEILQHHDDVTLEFRRVAEIIR